MPKLKTLYIMQIFFFGGRGAGRGRGLAFLKQCLLLNFSVGFMLYHCYDSSTQEVLIHLRVDSPMCFSYIYRTFIYLYSIHNNVHSVIKYSLKELTTSSFSLVP